MIIIVGLGNIGTQYQNTFHNIGFKVADEFARQIGAEFSKEKFKSMLAEGRVKGQSVLIAKPTTFMNNSGEAVVMLKNKYKDARIIVAVDDIDLEKGAVRYRQKGSSGTHNGLRSIVAYIGEDFERVRVGVGRDKSMDLADYVLSKIKTEDATVINKAVLDAVEIILDKI